MSKPRAWILRNGQVVANCIEWLANDLPDDTTYAVTVAPHKSSRSLEQNAYMWLLLTVIGDFTGYTKDDLYDYYIEKFAPIKVVDAFGETKPTRITSSRMDVEQMTTFLRQIEAHATTDIGMQLVSQRAP